jgi:hypothetical protein
LLLVVLITYQAIPYWGAAGAIFALIAVGVFETVVVWKYILPALQKRPQPQSPHKQRCYDCCIGVDGILKHFLTGWRPNKYAGFQRSPVHTHRLISSRFL